MNIDDVVSAAKDVLIKIGEINADEAKVAKAAFNMLLAKLPQDRDNDSSSISNRESILAQKKKGKSILDKVRDHLGSMTKAAQELE